MRTGNPPSTLPLERAERLDLIDLLLHIYIYIFSTIEIDLTILAGRRPAIPRPPGIAAL